MEFKLNFKDKKYILVKVKTSKKKIESFSKNYDYLSLPLFPAKQARNLNHNGSK
jgi:hypothetical protein